MENDRARIDRIILRCRDAEAQRSFYVGVLGMREWKDGTVGYPGEGARLLFLPADHAYQPRPDDVYWKIALAVPDLDLACRQLEKAGVRVGVPEQFSDIGYLAHLTDPEGFTIELIAHCFQGETSPLPAGPAQLGGGATLNLVTLRSASLEEIDRTCDAFGMKALAIMPVERYGFTLYFYAFTEEEPPSQDLSAVENRPWIYQRPYTVFEIQHRPGAPSGNLPGRHQSGYVETVFAGGQDLVFDNAFKLRMEQLPGRHRG